MILAWSPEFFQRIHPMISPLGPLARIHFSVDSSKNVICVYGNRALIAVVDGTGHLVSGEEFERMKIELGQLDDDHDPFAPDYGFGSAVRT